jgi:hypothetical protein
MAPYLPGAVFGAVPLCSARSFHGQAGSPDPIIQITTTFRARIDGLTDPRDGPSTTAQDTARRTLYNMAANECTVLTEFWPPNAG